MVNPYVEEQINFNTVIRTFEKVVNSTELVWHSDEFDRIVTVMNDCSGWLFQFDNSAPMYLKLNEVLEIHRDVQHRLIRFDVDTTTELIVKIQENICLSE